MPFTEESAIRTHTGWHNTDTVPSELIEQRLGDAHAALLVELDPTHAESTDALLKLAETELATAFILRSLASESGFEDRDVRTANLTIRAGGRARTLIELADEEERAAFRHARPFLPLGTSTVPLQLVTGP